MTVNELIIRLGDMSAYQSLDPTQPPAQREVVVAVRGTTCYQPCCAGTRKKEVGFLFDALVKSVEVDDFDRSLLIITVQEED